MVIYFLSPVSFRVFKMWLELSLDLLFSGTFILNGMVTRSPQSEIVGSNRVLSFRSIHQNSSVLIGLIIVISSRKRLCPRKPTVMGHVHLFLVHFIHLNLLSGCRNGGHGVSFSHPDLEFVVYANILIHIHESIILVERGVRVLQGVSHESVSCWNVIVRFVLLLVNHHHWVCGLVQNILEVDCVILSLQCFQHFVHWEVIVPFFQGSKVDVSVKCSHWMRLGLHIHL